MKRKTGSTYKRKRRMIVEKNAFNDEEGEDTKKKRFENERKK